MAPGSAAGPLAVDVIVIGGGVSGGLPAAAYLQKAGDLGRRRPWVQEVINAVEISHHEHRWVTLDGATHADRAGHDGGTESDPDAGGVA